MTISRVAPIAEIIESALTIEYDCKCCGPFICSGCIHSAMVNEVRRLREENKYLREEVRRYKPSKGFRSDDASW